MQVCGIICEYNPFHNGHAYHLREARRLSQADYIVCVMSGPVTQRGSFARHDKWSRTRAALQSGADLVLELPVRFSCAPAGEFASGSLSILRALGVVTHFSFGCESSALPLLDPVSQLYKEEGKPFTDALHARLASGLSYPAARAGAAQDVLRIPDLSASLSEPNAILALEYLTRLPDGMIPVPVERKGDGYHAAALSEYASATAIRTALESGDLSSALACVPDPEILRIQETEGYVHEPDSLDTALLFRLRTLHASELSQITGMSEGLENRFLDEARKAGTREDLLQAVKTRRYTYSRLSRISSHVLLHLTDEFASSHPEPEYARILGFRNTALPLLHTIKERTHVPLLSKCAGFSSPLFEKDVLAQDLWALGCRNPARRKAGQDYITSPILL